MKAAILATLFIVTCLFIGELKISLNPFEIELPRWELSVGCALMVLAFIFIMAGQYHEGYNDGLNKSKEILIELIKEKKDDGTRIR